MPNVYALRWMPTGQLLSCTQVNGYELSYYGIVLWETPPSPARVAEALATAGLSPDDPEGRLDGWEIAELTEHQAKMANVKLRNDPARSVAFIEGEVKAIFAT